MTIGRVGQKRIIDGELHECIEYNPDPSGDKSNGRGFWRVVKPVEHEHEIIPVAVYSDRKIADCRVV